VRSLKARRTARLWVRLRFGGWASVFGYVYMGVALTCLIDGSVTLGAVGLVLGVPLTWVCGLWVVPRSEDAYMSAVSACLIGWATSATGILARRSAASRDHAAMILASLPSSLSHELREKLGTALERQIENPVPTRDTVYARAISAYELRVLLESTLAQLEEGEADDAVRLRAAIAERRDASQVARREYSDALSQEQVCLAKIKSPTRLRERHGRYVQLVDRYRDAVDVCNDAINGAQAEEMQHAAEEMSELWQAMNDFGQAVANRLEEYYGQQSLRSTRNADE
jgi:hypothetical protein